MVVGFGMVYSAPLQLGLKVLLAIIYKPTLPNRELCPITLTNMETLLLL